MLKSYLFLLPLFCLTLFTSCHKEQEVVSHDPLYNVNNNGKQIRAEAVFHTEIITSNPMKAGEVFPKPNSSKARLEVDLFDRFQKEFGKDFPGITKEKLISLKIHWITVKVNEDRCKLLKEYRVTNITLPDGTKMLNEPVIANYCENWRINNEINNRMKDYYGKDIAPVIKSDGKLVLEYSLTADKDLVGTATGFQFDMKTELIFQAN